MLRLLLTLACASLLACGGTGDDSSESVTIFNDAFNLTCTDNGELTGDAALEILAEARVARAQGLRSLRVGCSQVNEPIVEGLDVDIQAILAGELDDEETQALADFVSTGNQVVTDSNELL